MIYTAEDANTVYAENRKEEKEEKELKNRILSMSNTDRKQKLWRELFSPFTQPDDSYLLGNLY